MLKPDAFMTRAVDAIRKSTQRHELPPRPLPNVTGSAVTFPQQQ